MLKSVKIIVREFTRKDGGNFTKVTIGGKYLPIVTADENTNYNVRFTNKSLVKEPVKSGIYAVSYEEGNLWIDSRMPEKNIVRLTAVRVMFDKPLPANKPVEETK